MCAASMAGSCTWGHCLSWASPGALKKKAAAAAAAAAFYGYGYGL